MSVVARRPAPKGVITGASLLQEAVTARTSFSGLVTFCSDNDVSVPASFVEALSLVQGWFYRGQDS